MPASALLLVVTLGIAPAAGAGDAAPSAVTGDRSARLLLASTFDAEVTEARDADPWAGRARPAEFLAAAAAVAGTDLAIGLGVITSGMLLAQGARDFEPVTVLLFPLLALVAAPFSAALTAHFVDPDAPRAGSFKRALLHAVGAHALSVLALGALLVATSLYEQGVVQLVVMGTALVARWCAMGHVTSLGLHHLSGAPRQLSGRRRGVRLPTAPTEWALTAR